MKPRKPGRTRVNYIDIAIDSALWILSVLIALVLRFDFELARVSLADGLFFATVLLTLAGVTGVLTNLYASRFVRGSVEEAFSVARNISLVLLLVGLVILLSGYAFGVPRSTVLITAVVFLTLSLAWRLGDRLRRLRQLRSTLPRKKAVIYGAGHAGITILSQLKSDSESPYWPVALLDDDSSKANRWISGVPMGGRWQDFHDVVRKYSASAVIVAIPSVSSEKLTEIYLDAKEANVEVVVLPSLRQYLEGTKSLDSLKKLSIEDLLGREQIEMEPDAIRRIVEGKRVLVTGAGGSIGSELVNQVSAFSPASIILADRDESALVLAQVPLSMRSPTPASQTWLVDVRDEDQVERLFEETRPEVVFHAAALKHVSFLERFPQEAWRTNVLGTVNVLRAASKSSVCSFVNISTDKAADPTSILGKSKKLSEELTAWFGFTTRARYVSVRFGNVLGSRGSLIPILAEQITRGGPVTLTDRDARRYFMSTQEACLLVLQAASLGETGNVMVLDMGRPVRIGDIAEKMIALSGKSVEIRITGLGPGEKQTESLFSVHESFEPSSHSKIWRVKSGVTNPDDLDSLQW